MAADQTKRTLRNGMLIAVALVATGAAISGLSLRAINAAPPQRIAQATQPLQGTPAPETTALPAESRPGGERPTTPAPEPAQPDAQAQKAGAKPVLPPAPAEKTAAPINQK
ncbi:signal peptide protein [Bradyrhizobium sp. LTSP885]|uniref:hypothetical protein n=1 Tax=Bradyrhizobium sp. LTSP885 TaxID=1619232 RepID=UPI0005CB2268|nr:hypothetical protein [Bradyrhizobium sp. LTSP885]KJC33829.1 signal peptide protein [Bradyrhizobium sp. LTSP885]